MSEFQLDTTGEVFIPDARYGVGATRIRWPDISPFAQGYVRRGLEEFYEQLSATNPDLGAWFAVYRALAPATLAAMLKDCEARETQLYAIGIRRHDQRLGAIFWLTRQRGDLSAFPPVTLTLGEDGKIHQQKAQPDVD